MDIVDLLMKYRSSTSLAEREEFALQMLSVIRPVLHRYIYFRCPQVLREDALQETLRDVFKSLGNYGGHRSFKAWCFTIASRRIADHLSEKNVDAATIYDGGELLASIEVSEVSDPISVADWIDFKEILRLLALANPPCVDYLKEAYIDDLSNLEIGKIHNQSADAARMQIKRCRKLARELVAD